MAQKSFTRLFGSLLCLFLLAVMLPSIAQTAKPKRSDREKARLDAMIAQAKKEEEQFSKSGGKSDDANHPNLKWAAAFWRYRLKHPGTPATTLATTQTFSLLSRTNNFHDMQAKADTLKFDDPAWERVIHVLLFASIRAKEYSYFITKAEALTQSATDPTIKARARFDIADVYWKQGNIAQARTNFQTVIARYPKTSYAEEAEGNVREIDFLNVGQLAPSFERTTINGDRLSLAEFKGKVVVLKFWGTY